MKYVFKILNKFYRDIVGSIAFFPILIGFAFTALAVILLSIENLEYSIKVKEKLSYLLIKDIDTARTMLSTIIGGIFSLTVFSFSMVMVVLSQASSNFSPRLLPGLISNKKHQVILGIYIGTLLYSLIVLMNVKNYETIEDSIGLSILLGVFFGVSCTGFFVYFIHTISQEIQIQNIVNRIYNSTVVMIDSKLKIQEDHTLETKENRIFTIKSKTTGYYKSFSKDLLFDSLATCENMELEILPYFNYYIQKGEIIIQSNQALSKEVSDALLFSITIEPNMHKSENYMANMIKLMEVAIRAMSPGINDPGTALDVINKLDLLLQNVFCLNRTNWIDQGQIKIWYNEIDYEEVMRQVFQPLRQYSKSDSVVMHKLMHTLNNLILNSAINNASKSAIQSELKALKTDAEKSIFNSNDLKQILNLI